MKKPLENVSEDENLKRMLKTPPKPHAPVKARKAKASQDQESNPKKNSA
jgi:hypothetical protein